jgi:predicted amidophosphoribosyltransferase
MSDALANAVCQRCQAHFAPAERIVNSNGELYHEHCFVCAQCFRPFPEGLFYEVRMPPEKCWPTVEAVGRLGRVLGGGCVPRTKPGTQ